MKLNYLLGIGIVLALVGASLLVAFGFLYIKPYINVRNFKEATCTTIQSFPTGQEVPCQCAADGSSSCVSFYPCLKIWVNFTKTEHSDTRNVTLYDSYETYFLQRETLQCSYHKCSRIRLDNAQAVKTFQENFGNDGQSYPCFYDPDNSGFVLLEIVALSTAINCILWPALALASGLVIFFVQIFHTDENKAKQRNQFSSLERQWARIRERSYGNVESTGSERLVRSDKVDEVGHVAAVCEGR